MSRDLRRFAQTVVAGVSVSLGAIPVAMLSSPAGAHGRLAEAAVVTIAASCLMMALGWLLRWPTRAQSASFVVVSTLCIAGSCLVDRDPLSGLMGCAAFAVIGGYVALFHTPRLMLFTLVVAVGTTVVLATFVAIDRQDVILAAGKLWLILIAMLSIPFAVQTLMQYLGVDAHDSDFDALTGLLNRRAFYRATDRLLASRQSDVEESLAIAMLDLDDFKRLNDNLGHAVGDRALIVVSQTLRQHSRGAAVIARVGGEEFLVADTYRTGEVARAATSAAENLRSAIATTPFGVTASVGIASALVTDTTSTDRRKMIDDLIDAADTAMYDAKRAGGNQVRHRP